MRPEELGPRLADILVTEIFDCCLLGEGCVPSIVDARRRLLRPGATIVPRAASLWCLPLDMKGGRCRGGPDADLRDLNALGCDGAIGQMTAVGCKLQRLDPKTYARLGPARRVFDFDFYTCDADATETAELTVRFAEEGFFNAVLFWFELDLIDGVPPLSNGPDADELCWDQNLRYLPCEITARRGEACTLVVRRTATRFEARVVKVAPGAVTADSVGHV